MTDPRAAELTTAMIRCGLSTGQDRSFEALLYTMERQVQCLQERVKLQADMIAPPNPRTPRDHHRKETMSYDYVRQNYGVDPKVGQRVTHTVTRKSGVIAREDKGQSHYVKVRFDGQKHTLPCHPTELDYTAPHPQTETTITIGG